MRRSDRGAAVGVEIESLIEVVAEDDLVPDSLVGGIAVFDRPPAGEEDVGIGAGFEMLAHAAAVGVVVVVSDDLRRARAVLDVSFSARIHFN